jgi:hypothetical protein
LKPFSGISIKERKTPSLNLLHFLAFTSRASLFLLATFVFISGASAQAPNLNKGAFKVQLQNFTSSKAEVAVFDARGTLLQRRVLNPSTNTIADFDLKGKAKGLYYLKVMTDEGVKVSKVVIQ